MDNCIEKLLTIALDSPRKVAITDGKFDTGAFKTSLDKNEPDIVRETLYTAMPDLNTRLPFLMAVQKCVYLDIGGYDEDFTGRCYDDNDFSDRLEAFGCEFVKTDGRCVHLHHDKDTSAPGYSEGMALNKKLYTERKGVIVRNTGREWGVLK
jgi:hypothetical protein